MLKRTFLYKFIQSYKKLREVKKECEIITTYSSNIDQNTQKSQEKRNEHNQNLKSKNTLKIDTITKKKPKKLKQKTIDDLHLSMSFTSGAYVS